MEYKEMMTNSNLSDGLDCLISGWTGVSRRPTKTQIVFSVASVNFCWLSPNTGMVQVWPPLGPKCVTRRLERMGNEVKVIHQKTGRIDTVYHDPTGKLIQRWNYPGFMCSRTSPSEAVDLIKQGYEGVKTVLKVSDTSSRPVSPRNAMISVDGFPSLTKAKLMLSKSKVLNMVDQLKKLYSYPQFELESHVYLRDQRHRNPYKVVVLFLLSVGTNDTRLVEVCRNFFAKFPAAKSLVSATDEEIMATIRPLGLYNRKLQHIRSLRTYIGDRGNRIPEEASELQQITGIGAKVLECILAYGFGKPSLPVDGNVLRILYRLHGNDTAKTTSLDSNQVRSELKEMFKESEWIDTHELLRLHAITICKKDYPECELCPLEFCQSRLSQRALRGTTAIAKAREKARKVIDNEWEPWRRLICDP